MIHALINTRTRKLRITHAYFSGLGSFFRLSITTKVEYTKNMRSTHKFAITF